MTAFQSSWKLEPGSPYNPDYVLTFIKENVAQPAFRGSNIKYTATAQPDSHVVDLVLTFSR
jgi:outer membrane protein insertion porin family